ncbi:hypothetical protein BGW80DRAFT_1256135 [Lactifluus volemus]|nr:hypothetical protein BGW80DRAFT_1256135 [Lactifluus volemus]
MLMEKNVRSSDSSDWAWVLGIPMRKVANRRGNPPADLGISPMHAPNTAALRGGGSQACPSTDHHDASVRNIWKSTEPPIRTISRGNWRETSAEVTTWASPVDARRGAHNENALSINKRKELAIERDWHVIAYTSRRLAVESGVTNGQGWKILQPNSMHRWSKAGRFRCDPRIHHESSTHIQNGMLGRREVTLDEEKASRLLRNEQVTVRG